MGSSETFGPVRPAISRIGDIRLSWLANITLFGTPEDVPLDGLKIEHFFPVDYECRHPLKAMAEQITLPPVARPADRDAMWCDRGSAG